jgi:hypothetical protein
MQQDVVLIAGKGHEDYQETACVRQAAVFDDLAAGPGSPDKVARRRHMGMPQHETS